MSSSHTETRSYRCICGKSYKTEHKFTKHQIKRGHGIHKKKVKCSRVKERKRKDLVGSILTGMKSHQSEEWDGQLTLQNNQPVVYQNTSAYSTQKQDPKSKTRCSNSSLSTKKPLPIFEESQSSGSSKQRVSHKTPSLLHLQAKEKIKMRVRETTSKKDNKRRKDNSQTTDSHGTFSKHMNGVKSMKSKSAWAGSHRDERIGSMRTAYRPDRAYDIHRNNMDVNDSAHPNDEFDLCRITKKK